MNNGLPINIANNLNCQSLLVKLIISFRLNSELIV